MKKSKNALKDEQELKVLSLAILSFCLIHSETFSDFIKKESEDFSKGKKLREAISSMGDNLYTVLHLLHKPGKMANRMSKLLGDHVPMDVATPKLSTELVERLKNKSFLFM